MNNNFLYLFFQIDTNRINSKQSEANMNKLEKWRDDGYIKLEISEAAQNEAKEGNDVVRRKKATELIFSSTENLNDVEIIKYKKIENIIFPNGPKNQNERNDVEIVFNASKYGRILITTDGDSKRQPRGILGSREDLKRDLDITVMNDIDAVKLVEQKIKQRK